MDKKQYYFYILTNEFNSMLYTDVTDDLKVRVMGHKLEVASKFTRRFKLNKLVYFEVTDDINVAIAHQKQARAGSRQKKIDLIETINPEWKDLFDDLLS